MGVRAVGPLPGRASGLAEADSRTISNMAKVLIQQGVERLEHQQAAEASPALPSPPAAAEPPSIVAAGKDPIRRALEQRHRQAARPLRRGPRRVRLQRPPADRGGV